MMDGRWELIFSPFHQSGLPIIFRQNSNPVCLCHQMDWPTNMASLSLPAHLPPKKLRMNTQSHDLLHCVLHNGKLGSVVWPLQYGGSCWVQSVLLHAPAVIFFNQPTSCSIENRDFSHYTVVRLLIQLLLLLQPEAEFLNVWANFLSVGNTGSKLFSPYSSLEKDVRSHLKCT